MLLAFVLARLWLWLTWPGRHAVSPRLDALHGVGTSLGMIDPVCAVVFQARALRVALRTGEPARLSRSLAIEATFLASQGRRAQPRARRCVAHAAALAGEDPYLLALSRAAAGIVAYYGEDQPFALAELSWAETALAERTSGKVWELNTVRLFRLGVLAMLGRLGEVGARLDAHLADAIARDDRYTGTTLVRMFNFSWLARDQPDEARRQLDSHGWVPPAHDFHLQHFFELIARLDVAAYEGRAAGARAEHAARITALEKSLMMYMQTARGMADWALGRLALAEGDLALARRRARRLSGEGLGQADVCAALLRAGALLRERNAEGALPLLEAAKARASALHFGLFAACADRLAGAVMGGDAGRARREAADARLSALGARNPERLRSLVLPFECDP